MFPLDGDQWVDVHDVVAAAEWGHLQGGPITATPMVGDEHELHKHPELALRMVAAAVDEIEKLHQPQPVA